MPFRKSFTNTMKYGLITLSGLGLVSFGVLAAPVAPLHTPGATTASSAILIAEDSIDHKKAEDFVQNLAQTAIDFLSDDSLSESEKTEKFDDLLSKRFDMRSIGRFALGRYWRNASPAQQKEYLDLFNDMILEVYSRRFSEYQGQTITVLSSRPEGNRDILVASVIKEANSPDIRLDWRLRSTNGQYKVIDVIVEGVSMALTQRSDFASVIQRGGGNIQVLLNHLKTRQAEK